MLDRVFERLGLTNIEAHVYLTLLDGVSSAGNLAKKLGIARSTLYDNLANLQHRGLVTQSERKGVKVWAAESPERVQKILEDEASNWNRVLSDYQILLPSLKARESVDLITPRFSYYEGIDGVKRVLSDMLLYRDIRTFALWPVKDTVELLGDEFFFELNRVRVRQNIFVRGLWPADKVLDLKKYPCFGSGDAIKRELRVTPPQIECSMGYWAYQNKVAFLSSKKECFGFIVESRELLQMLETQFNVIWQVSRPLRVEDRYMQKFLSSV